MGSREIANPQELYYVRVTELAHQFTFLHEISHPFLNLWGKSASKSCRIYINFYKAYYEIQWTPSIAVTLEEQNIGRYIGVAFI